MQRQIESNDKLSEVYPSRACVYMENCCAKPEAVYAFFTSKQILHFAFTEQSTSLIRFILSLRSFALHDYMIDCLINELMIA